MLNLFLPHELLQDYINRQERAQELKESVEILQNSSFLLGCRKDTFVCVTDLSSDGEGRATLEEFNVGKSLRYEVVARIFTQDIKKNEKSVESKNLVLVKKFLLGKKECILGVELIGIWPDAVVVVIYCRKQFEGSVFINIRKENFSNVVDCIGNSLKVSRAFHQCRNGTKEMPYAELNSIFLLVYWMALKLLALNSAIKHFFCHLMTHLPMTACLSAPSVLVEVGSSMQCLRATLPIACHHKLQQHLTLGILTFLLLFNNIPLHDITHSLSSLAEGVGRGLEDLLAWLEGVPAGLKLNRPMALLLSAFFKYHVMLWRAYLEMLLPMSDSIFLITSMSCFFSCSLYLSVLLDLLSLATLHVYCFYVYAARLYFYQLKALRHLWRLFRGKRWNEEAGRVEEGQFRVHVLFLSTLLFTILLFLLPTTITFYVVFTCLRLIILSVHVLIGQVISFLHKNPSYWLLLALLRPIKLAGSVETRLMPDYECNAVSLQLVRSSWQEIIRISSEQRKTTTTPSTLSSPLSSSSPLSPPPSSSSSSSTTPSSSSSAPQAGLLKKLLLGELIYPWVQRVHVE